jgi:hypothetical protein
MCFVFERGYLSLGFLQVKISITLNTEKFNKQSHYFLVLFLLVDVEKNCELKHVFNEECWKPRVHLSGDPADFLRDPQAAKIQCNVVFGANMAKIRLQCIANPCKPRPCDGFARTSVTADEMGTR